MFLKLYAKFCSLESKYNNNSKHYYQVKEGEPIAQLILEKASMPILKQIKKLPTTERGDRGCGFHSQGGSSICKND